MESGCGNTVAYSETVDLGCVTGKYKTKCIGLCQAYVRKLLQWYDIINGEDNSTIKTITYAEVYGEEEDGKRQVQSIH